MTKKWLIAFFAGVSLAGAAVAADSNVTFDKRGDAAQVRARSQEQETRRAAVVAVAMDQQHQMVLASRNDDLVDLAHHFLLCDQGFVGQSLPSDSYFKP